MRRAISRDSRAFTTRKRRIKRARGEKSKKTTWLRVTNIPHFHAPVRAPCPPDGCAASSKPCLRAIKSSSSRLRRTRCVRATKTKRSRAIAFRCFRVLTRVCVRFCADCDRTGKVNHARVVSGASVGACACACSRVPRARAWSRAWKVMLSRRVTNSIDRANRIDTIIRRFRVRCVVLANEVLTMC